MYKCSRNCIYLAQSVKAMNFFLLQKIAMSQNSLTVKINSKNANAYNFQFFDICNELCA